MASTCCLELFGCRPPTPGCATRCRGGALVRSSPRCWCTATWAAARQACAGDQGHEIRVEYMAPRRAAIHVKYVIARRSRMGGALAATTVGQSTRKWPTGRPRASSSSSPSRGHRHVIAPSSAARLRRHQTVAFGIRPIPGRWCSAVVAGGYRVPAERPVVAVRGRKALNGGDPRRAGLNKNFGAVTAASDINAAIERDSVVGLIAPTAPARHFINMITGPQARPRAHPLRGPRHHRARAARRHAPGICRSFQIPQLTPRHRVRDMLVGNGVSENAGRAILSRGPGAGAGHDLPAEDSRAHLERFALAEYATRTRRCCRRKSGSCSISRSPWWPSPDSLLDEPTRGGRRRKFVIMEMICGGCAPRRTGCSSSTT